MKYIDSIRLSRMHSFHIMENGTIVLIGTATENPFSLSINHYFKILGIYPETTEKGYRSIIKQALNDETRVRQLRPWCG